MKLDEYLRLIAGAFVLIAVILGATVHPYWNYFAAFVAINLIQSAFTGWCPMMGVAPQIWRARVDDRNAARTAAA
jgi:hypothetical protein